MAARLEANEGALDGIDHGRRPAVRHFQGGSASCLNELNLFYLCFSILGEEMKRLSSINAIVDAALERALTGFAENIDQVNLLVQLSSFPQVQDRLYVKVRASIQGALAGLSVQNYSLEVKEALIEIVRNLSRSVGNKQAIYRDFLQTLCHDLMCGESLRIKRFSLGALNNLATLEENAVTLLRKPLFLETIVTLTMQGETQTIRERALWTLQSLACADENEVPMFETPKLVDTLVACLESGETDDIKGYAIETLRNLANQNHSRMKENRVMISALLQVIIFIGNKDLVLVAYSCLERIGIAHDSVRFILAMEAICSVRMVPRLGQASPIGVLPNELLRKTAEMLHGRCWGL